MFTSVGSMPQSCSFPSGHLSAFHMRKPSGSMMFTVTKVFSSFRPTILLFRSLLQLLHDGPRAFSTTYFHIAEESRSAFAYRHLLLQLFRGRATYLLDCSKRGRHSVQHLLASTTERILSHLTQICGGGDVLAT